MPSGFISYVSWWEKVEQVKIKKVNLEAQNSGSAIVKVRLQYVMKNTQELSEPESVRLWLLRDSETNRWMINYSRCQICLTINHKTFYVVFN